MEDDEDRRVIPTAQPIAADSSERAGSTRQREDKRFSGFEDLDWRDNELHKLDFLDIDEEEEEARAERRLHASRKLPEGIPAAVNVSNVVPEPLEAGEEGPFNKQGVAANDTCRICSGPAEPGMPLYHPCKCSGTIRHVHQDCLKSWLDTSHRTRCDLCNHTFTYKKRYSTNMPSTLPARVVIGPMLTQVANWAVVFMRLLLVGTVWLALLPALLHWCWRVGFWLSDYVSLRLSGKLYYLELYGNRFLNATDPTSNASSSIMPSTSYSTYLPDSIHPEATFPISLLEALSTAFPTHEPLSSAISTLQAMLRKHTPTATGTEPAATPDSSAVMMASAFSQIASILQETKRNSRRSRFFRMRRTVPGDETPLLQRFALYISGKAMFEQGSSFYWDLLRLGYHVIYRTCGWILSSCFTLFMRPYHLLRELFDAARSAHSNGTSTWQMIDEFAEELTTPIVTGQMIAVAIVVAFVLLFFLREWVMVNAEPGMFDDGHPPEQAAGANENGAVVAPQDPNANVIRDDVPGAFPVDLNPPIAAARPAEWDRDVDLAEPRPPSPNIISLEEQQELMKEVIARRKEQAMVISKSKAKVDEWQWEKKKVIINDWKEQKMKAIKDKVAVEDDGTDLFERDLGSSTHTVGSSEKGKGKGKGPFDDSDKPWEKFQFRDIDGIGSGRADMEHIENLHRPTRKMPHHSRRYETSGDVSVAASSAQYAGTSSIRVATPSETTPVKRLGSFEFSFSTPRSFPQRSVSINEPSTSFHPGEPLTSSTVSLEIPAPPPLPAALIGSEPILALEEDQQAIGQEVDGFIYVPSSPTAATEISKDLQTSNLSLPAIQPPTERIAQTLDITVRGEQVPKSISATNPALSVFSALVPPTPPSSTPAKLPFSVRDLKVAPLERSLADPMTTKGRSFNQSGQSTQFLNGGSEEANDSLAPGFMSGMARPAKPSSRERFFERGTMKLQGNRDRPGPPRVPQNIEEPTHTAAYFSQPLPAPTPQRPPPNWIHGIVPSLPLEGARTNDPPMPFVSRPFVFPQSAMSEPGTAVHSGGHFSPLSQGIQRPPPITAPPFNINAKPFQPGTKSAPITPTDQSGSGMAPRGNMGFPQPLAVEPFGIVPMPRPPGSAPLAYAPFEAGRAGFFPEPSYPSPFSLQSYAVTHPTPGLGPIPVSATFNAGGIPTHGHRMSMGMGPGRPTHSPSILPFPARGRAFTTGTDGSSPQMTPSQPLNGAPVQSTRNHPHQRSSSLSTHVGRSSAMRVDENNLLRPSSSSSGDSSTPSSAKPGSAKISPIPWYGLPDPRPDIDRKQLEEMEKKEERKKQRAAKSQGKGKRADMNKTMKQSTQAAAVELVIIESGMKRRDQPETSSGSKHPNPASEGNRDTQKHSLKPTDHLVQDSGNEANKNVQSTQESGQKPVGALQKPERQDSASVLASTGALVPTPEVCASPTESTRPTMADLASERASLRIMNNESAQKASVISSSPPITVVPGQVELKEPSHSVQTPKELVITRSKSSSSITNSQPTHVHRTQGPGSITIPNFEQNLTGQVSGGSPLKRPPLPSAASPIVIEERPTSKIALYQAPEEVRPQGRQGDGQTFLPQNGFMDYFQPLDGDRSDMEAKDMQDLRIQAGSEGHEGNAHEFPIEEDLPDFVDFDVGPEDDAMVEGAEALVDMPNAENAAAAAPPAEDVWEDEWTHLLEAVGMTGPWYCIVQNAALVIVIFNVTLGVGIFMPYILGKTTSLILADPSSLMVQLATSGDRPGFFGKRFPPLWRPRQGASFSLVGKGVALLFGDLVPSVKYAVTVSQRVARSYLATASQLFVLVRGPAVAEKMDTATPNLIYRLWSVIRPSSIISGFLGGMLHSFRWYQRNMPCRGDAPAASSLVNVIRVVDHAICSFYPEVLKNSTPINSAFNYWVLASLHEIATDRTSAIIFGYLITIAALALHARISVQRNSYMVLMLFKVGCFVLFEAVIKPLSFGFIIDIFTLSLFPAVSVQSRIAFWRSAPYSNLFHHWLVGNVVVVQFLYFLQDIQKSLRPGALLQVRKALDPTTPSMRDMINKSLSWHALKYMVTLTTNICLLWMILGLTIDVNNLLTSNFAPLRWNLRHPLSEVPVDLVILHIFLPATFRFLKFKRVIRNMSKTYFTELSKLLNLQSVLLGETLIDTVAGSYWRVPVAEDAIRLAGKPYAIQTDDLGNGLTQEDKDMIDMQILASRNGQRIPHNDYKVVFYPDWFLLRVAIFVLALWAAFFGAAWTSITLPIRIGRLMFKIMFDTTTVHDGYSWIVGLYVFWFGSFAKYLVGREQRRWSKYLSTRTKSTFPVKLFLRHTAAMLGRLALAVLWLIFLLPGLIGLLFEIYVVLPITYQFYPGLTPTLRLMDAWATGMIISAIALRAARLGQPDQLPELFERIRREGWFKIKARALTSELGPLTLGLAVLVFAPLVLQYILPTWLSESNATGSAVLKVFLPALFFILATSVVVTTVHGILYMWVETIRDQKYLEKEIIQNMEST